MDGSVTHVPRPSIYVGKLGGWSTPLSLSLTTVIDPQTVIDLPAPKIKNHGHYSVMKIGRNLAT